MTEHVTDAATENTKVHKALQARLLECSEAIEAAVNREQLTLAQLGDAMTREH